MDKKIAQKVPTGFAIVYFVYALCMLILSLPFLVKVVPALGLSASFGSVDSMQTIASMILGAILQTILVVSLWKLIKGNTSVFKYIVGVEIFVFMFPIINMLSLPVPTSTIQRVLLSTSIQHLLPIVILYILLRANKKLFPKKKA